MHQSPSIRCGILQLCVAWGAFAWFSQTTLGQDEVQPVETTEGRDTSSEKAMDPYLEKLFASPNDFDLANGIYMRVSEQCDGFSKDEVRELPEEHRVVLNIWDAGGIIGNGGFQYLFEHRRADLPAIAEAYDVLNIPAASEAVRKALSVFPNSQLHDDVEERLEYLDRLGPTVNEKLVGYSKIIWRTDREMKRKLGAYIRANRDAFVSLPPTKWEDLDEISKKNLPPPEDDNDEEAVVAWLKSIGAKVSRWSDIASFPVASQYVAPTEGDPIFWIDLDDDRATTDDELAALVRYSLVREVRRLDLTNTCLTVDGLRQLSRFPNLEELNLSKTDLDDSGLPIVASLPALKRLVLDDTGITDTGLASLGKCASLRQLDLMSTRVHGLGLHAFGESPGLENLDLFGCEVTDADLIALEHFTRLRDLGLRNTGIGDATLKTINGLTELKTLNLTATRVTDEGLPLLSRMVRLKSLWLDGTSIDGSGFGRLSDLSQLTELSLYGSKIDDEGAAEISKLKSLTNLTLSNTMVTDACFEHLANLENLESVSLSGTKLEGGKSLRRLEVLRSLKSLSLPPSLKENSNVNYLRRKRPGLEISFY